MFRCSILHSNTVIVLKCIFRVMNSFSNKLLYNRYVNLFNYFNIQIYKFLCLLPFASFLWDYIIFQDIFYQYFNQLFFQLPSVFRIWQLEKGSLVTKHSVPYFLPNYRMAELNAALSLATRARKCKYIYSLKWQLNPQYSRRCAVVLCLNINRL